MTVWRGKSGIKEADEVEILRAEVFELYKNSLNYI